MAARVWRFLRSRSPSVVATIAAESNVHLL
jgi:hypothetical protein